MIKLIFWLAAVAAALLPGLGSVESRRLGQGRRNQVMCTYVPCDEEAPNPDDRLVLFNNDDCPEQFVLEPDGKEYCLIAT
eukprot:scaffold3961_cov109-Skeletonema_dohrnii-CCMP3373.AAC.1